MFFILKNLHSDPINEWIDICESNRIFDIAAPIYFCDSYRCNASKIKASIDSFFDNATTTVSC